MHNKQVILYSTEGCHLCEQALSLLNECNIEPDLVDIAFDENLFSRYGVTIPVVKQGDNELEWPFQLEQLQKWLKNNG